MSGRWHRTLLVALLIAGSAILLFSCKAKSSVAEESLDAIKTEESENLTIVMSENGRKSYLFKTPLLEGYTLGRDPYREFRKGISITTYQDDSLTTVNAVLVANYAIYYENRKLWEAKGDVVITKHDGTRLYTQQLFWNSITKRIYSNVDTKLVTETDEVIGEGFESDEDMEEPRFRRWKGKMQVDTEQLRKESKKPADKDNKEDANGTDGVKKSGAAASGTRGTMSKRTSNTTSSTPLSSKTQPQSKSRQHSSLRANPPSPMQRPSRMQGGSQRPMPQGQQQNPKQRNNAGQYQQSGPSNRPTSNTPQGRQEVRKPVRKSPNHTTPTSHGE